MTPDPLTLANELELLADALYDEAEYPEQVGRAELVRDGARMIRDGHTLGVAAVRQFFYENGSTHVVQLIDEHFGVDGESRAARSEPSALPDDEGECAFVFRGGAVCG